MQAYRHVFQVQGRYPFPIDMLRYDGCHPATEEEAHTIQRLCDGAQSQDREPVVIDLVKVWERCWSPTDGRWRSHGWQVIDVQPPHKL